VNENDLKAAKFITGTIVCGNEKESKGMFDTFKEVVDRIDGRAGGWETVTTTLVTPDGKRWKMSKIRVVFTDDNEEDELECELVEVPNRT